jgi:hypothetical protein
MANDYTIMPKEYTLTRFLYPLDEVEYSFLHSLLNKTNLQECYFWIFEIYFSGFAVFPFLWKIYLDFYKERNSSALEEYILKKQTTNNKDEVIAIAAIVRNLFRALPSPNVFLLRQYFTRMTNSAVPKLFSKQERDAFAASLPCPKKYLVFLLSLHTGHFPNVCFYLNHFLNADDSDANIDALCQLLDSKVLAQPSIHYLLALCVSVYNTKNHITIKNSLMIKNSIINPIKNMFVSPTDADIKAILSTNETKNGFNTLKTHRLFSICDKIGCFALQRRTIGKTLFLQQQHVFYDEFIYENRMNWEYYAMRSPLWQSRLPPNCTIDHVKREIVFQQADFCADADANAADADANAADADDIKENFYALYGLDFDEQPVDIIQMSHKDIPFSSLKEWCQQVFFADADANALLNDSIFFNLLNSFSDDCLIYF